MKKDIILAGVGGQGILTIAACIGLTAVNRGMYLKQAEVHGMSQRGGAVQSHLRISDQEIASDLIPEGECDLILAVEPMEALRYLNYLSAEHGWVVSSDAPFNNIPDYPELDDLKDYLASMERHRLVPADELARELGSVKASNMVMLGAALDILGFEAGEMEAALESLFGKKGADIMQLNRDAILAGSGAVFS